MADHDQSRCDCPACADARRRVRVLLIALAFAAGCTDAVTYLKLGQVFTANMTGNTVLLGIAIVAGDGARIARSACALAGFCAGVALAASCIGPERVQLWPRRTALVLLGETAMLTALGIAAAVTTSGSGRVYGLIALSGIAMGAQSAVVRAVAVSGVATTYITGTLTGMIASLSECGGRGEHGGPGDERPGRDDERPQPADTRRLALLIWLFYLGAALAAAALAQAVAVQAIWLPAFVVAGVLSARPVASRSVRRSH